jgi:hypothetical protein
MGVDDLYLHDVDQLLSRSIVIYVWYESDSGLIIGGFMGSVWAGSSGMCSTSASCCILSMEARRSRHALGRVHRRA